MMWAVRVCVWIVLIFQARIGCLLCCCLTSLTASAGWTQWWPLCQNLYNYPPQPLRVLPKPLRGLSLPLRGLSLPLRGLSLPLRGLSLPLRGLVCVKHMHFYSKSEALQPGTNLWEVCAYLWEVCPYLWEVCPYLWEVVSLPLRGLPLSLRGQALTSERFRWEVLWSVV